MVKEAWRSKILQPQGNGGHGHLIYEMTLVEYLMSWVLQTLQSEKTHS